MLPVLCGPFLIRKMFGCCPDLYVHQISRQWSIVAERLVRHHMPVTTVDELWHRIEATWTSVHAIKSLFDSIPSRLSAVITARGVVLGTVLSGSMHPNFLNI
ncbi:hypothetical protein TNCV_1319271 [Trichonephila clavipes]|nr:hypothetical protein TNCV_1319271 [Trichonephila clavipes]